MDKPGESSSIPLYVVDGTATVWDAQTVATIHCEHDISGLRAGTLPGVVQQNAFLGLPFTLMKEETAALVNKGVAHLVAVPITLQPPSDDVVAQRTAARVARNRRLAVKLREEEEAKQREAAAKYAVVGEAAKAKRAARSRKRAEAARVASLANGEDEAAVQAKYEAAIAAIEAEKEDGQPKETSVDAKTEEKRPTPTAENTNMFTVVPSMPIHDSLNPTHTVTMPSSEFPFPVSVRDRALVGTFAALQAKGLRMGLGPRFGGEWLVYPGDYLRYHAHFTSQVIVRDEPIMPAQLVAWGRLGTGTKKAGLLCCWDDGGDEHGEGEVDFYSLEWANFG